MPCLLVPSLLSHKELWQTVCGLWEIVHNLLLVISVNVSCFCSLNWQEFCGRVENGWEPSPLMSVSFIDRQTLELPSSVSSSSASRHRGIGGFPMNKGELMTQNCDTLTFATPFWMVSWTDYPSNHSWFRSALSQYANLN